MSALETTKSSIRTPMVITKAILYGNTAKHFGSKRDGDGHTHKWTVFVRPFHQHEDMSLYISRVQFRLHETYANHVRVISQAPYEVEESGWGEFEVQITLFLTDPNEKPVSFYHHLRLFSTDADVITGKRPLLNEFYDELIFHEPSDFLLQRLQCGKSPLTDEERAREREYARKKAETIVRIKKGRQRVRTEIHDLTERLRVTQENIKRLRQRTVDTAYPPGLFTAVADELID